MPEPHESLVAVPSPFAGFNPFLNVQAPKNLIIIAPDVFMQAVQPLVKHKNKTSMPTIAVSISSLKPFFTGVDDPETIKNAVRYAHENLGTQYVMLVGDATFFPVRYMFIHVPPPPGPPTLGTPGYGGDPNIAIPVTPDGIWHLSDLYYANLYHHDGTYPNFTALTPDNWDANGNGLYNEFSWGAPAGQPLPNELTTSNPDKVDAYVDVAVGRIPAHSAADVTAYVNKIIEYEGTVASPIVAFTFVADHQYPTADTLTTGMVSKSGIADQPAFNALAYLLIDDAGGPPPTAPWQSAQPATVSNYASQSAWVSYVGHGAPHQWGSAFGDPNVAQVKGTWPVVFAAGCQTGQFVANPPWSGPYLDVSGTTRNFQSVPDTMSGENGPAIQDLSTGQQWGTGCNPAASCLPIPMSVPKPNPYDLDRGPNVCFSYPWLISPSGGIAYFGESCVASDQMGVELQTYMLQGYTGSPLPILGDLYRAAQQAYWLSHQHDTGAGPDVHSVTRLYLTCMVFFGDPSLRLPTMISSVPFQPAGQGGGTVPVRVQPGTLMAVSLPPK